MISWLSQLRNHSKDQFKLNIKYNLLPNVKNNNKINNPRILIIIKF